MKSYLNGGKQLVYVNSSFSSPFTTSHMGVGSVCYLLYAEIIFLRFEPFQIHTFAITAAADSQTQPYEFLSYYFRRGVRLVEKTVLNVNKTRNMTICAAEKAMVFNIW